MLSTEGAIIHLKVQQEADHLKVRWLRDPKYHHSSHYKFTNILEAHMIFHVQSLSKHFSCKFESNTSILRWGEGGLNP